MGCVGLSSTQRQVFLVKGGTFDSIGIGRTGWMRGEVRLWTAAGPAAEVRRVRFPRGSREGTRLREPSRENPFVSLFSQGERMFRCVNHTLKSLGSSRFGERVLSST